MPAEATRASDPATGPALLPGWMVLGILTLPGRPEHVREARQFVARSIDDDYPRADTALLLTSELVTNAVIHSRSRLPGGTVTVVVARKLASLVVTVTDGGSNLTAPEIRSRSGGSSGHGLLLVQTLADVWGYVDDEACTVVWFQLSDESHH